MKKVYFSFLFIVVGAALPCRVVRGPIRHLHLFPREYFRIILFSRRIE